MKKWFTMGWIAMLAVTGCAMETGTEPGGAAGSTETTAEHAAAGEQALGTPAAEAKTGTTSLLGHCPSGPQRMQCARNCYVRFHDEAAVDACVDSCNACW